MKGKSNKTSNDQKSNTGNSNNNPASENNKDYKAKIDNTSKQKNPNQKK